MPMDYKFIADLLADVNVPTEGIFSRVLQKDEHVNITLFGFSPGQELSTHSAPTPAVLYFLTGEADVTLGELADPARLKPFDAGDKQTLRVVVETPKGRRNKFAFDPDERIFELKKVLPAGMAFPYDFGFVPSTEADDGDPVDVFNSSRTTATHRIGTCSTGAVICVRSYAETSEETHSAKDSA